MVLQYACPLNALEPWASHVVELYVWMRDHGALPEAGGVLDQSAWLMDAFMAVRRAVAEMRETT